MDLLFHLKKAISHLLYPSGLVFIFLLLSFLTSFSRYRRSQTRFFLTLAAIFFYLSTTSFLPRFFLEPLEARFRVPLEEELESAEAIVLLPCYIASDPGLRLIDRLGGETSKRFLAVLLLKQKFPEKPLLIVGAGAGGKTGASYLKELAQNLGFKKVIALDAPKDTVSSAREVKRFLGRNKPVVLVTAAYHLPRAVFLFRQEGLKPIPYPAYRISKPSKEITWQDLWPHPLNLFYLDLAVHEYLGLAFYYFMDHIASFKKGRS